MCIPHRCAACVGALSAHLHEAGRAPLAACAAMSARIASVADNHAAGVETRSTMINAIGAMHAAMRVKKRPEEEINLRVEVKKRRRKPRDDDEDSERPRRERVERGHRA